VEGEIDYCLHIVQTEGVADKYDSSVFGKEWRFCVPDGFMLYDENEMKMGTSLVFDLDKAPEHLSLRVKGAYRNKHR